MVKSIKILIPSIIVLIVIYFSWEKQSFIKNLELKGVVVDYEPTLPFLGKKINTILGLNSVSLLDFDAYEGEIDFDKVFSDFNGIKVLKMSGIENIKLKVFANLPNLEEVYFSFCTFSNFNQIELLTNIKTLHLPGCFISDVTPISKLTRIEDVNLVGNQVKDYSPMYTLNNLKMVYLSNVDLNKMHFPKNVTIFKAY